MQTEPTQRAVPLTSADVRLGDTPEGLKASWLEDLFFIQGKFPDIATRHDYYMALAYAVRDRLLNRWICSSENLLGNPQTRAVAYLSAEFLIGPQLEKNLIELGLLDAAHQVATELGFTLQELLNEEEEPGLGNGGLGRLAACYLEALATQQIPAIGYSLRYEFGIFDQLIHDGWQIEIPDEWLKLGNPWEVCRPELGIDVKLGGRTEPYTDSQGRYCVRWLPERIVRGIPYDTLIAGYHVNTVNTLRLWKASSPHGFDFQAFNQGDYYKAVANEVESETLSKVLYPNDSIVQGKALRLAQQYFFVSCSLQDMVKILAAGRATVQDFAKHFTVQLNDTHPAIAIAELMRLLIDDHQLEWEEAWIITTSTCNYTNHTLLPEALEKWTVPLFAQLLPRHLEIIYEINERFLEQVRMRFPGDQDRLRRLSIIDEMGDRAVRMAHLACVGSHRINGVSALHSRLLQEQTLHDFYELWPEKFLNVTNGVTPRRFLLVANPPLSQLFSERLGEGWITHLEDLHKLEPLVEDRGFQEEWRQSKQVMKHRLAVAIQAQCGLSVDPTALFDVQVKRIHEYKRQHLNILRIVHEYLRLKENPQLDLPPRLYLFAGKAAPSYALAKLMIKLINAVAEMIDRDPQVSSHLKVIFLPDYNVTRAQLIYPAADLSEQISTAGYEASGTSNMKLALNGALTIGTLDGANVEIRDAVGPENFFLFGLTAEEVQQRRREGYQPRAIYDASPSLRAALDLIGQGHFSGRETGLFQPLIENLLTSDPFLVLADFQAYCEVQEQISLAWQQPEIWTRLSILNSIRCGYFSADRAVREYGDQIWNTQPQPVTVCPLMPSLAVARPNPQTSRP
jgi:glycogen phosphorylase